MEDTAECSASKDLLRRPGVEILFFVNGDKLVTVSKRLLQIVQHHDDRFPVLFYFRKQIHEHKLVLNIQI